MINVSTGEFYGPFDLLLELIKKSKYDIYDVRLSEITNEYINSIKKLNIPADETADFILIATQLLYLKTAYLIKDTSENYEEEDDIVLEDELIRRLLEYKRIKSVIKRLRVLEEEGKKKYYKLQEDLSIYRKENNDLEYDINSLKIALEGVISLYLRENEFKVDKILNIEEYSLEEYNNSIKIQLIKEKMISITKMITKIKNKSEVIIIFLSILELSKTKLLSISQDETSLEIVVKLKEETNE